MVAQVSDPAEAPSDEDDIHYYETDAGTMSYPFVARSHSCAPSYRDAEELLLSYPGIKYLMYTAEGVDPATGLDRWFVIFGYIPPGEMTSRSLVEPMTVVDILAGRQRRFQALEDKLTQMLRTYPHLCPRCGSSAYVGFNSVDCSRRCH